MLHVHHAGRAEDLVEVLAGLLSEPLDDPFTPDVVSVPSRGIERWIAQQLALRLGGDPKSGSGRDGVTANIRFLFPGRLLQLHEDGMHQARPSATEVWQPGTLTWRILAQLRRHATDTLTETGPTGLSDISVARARHIAMLFDRYAVYRPSLLHQWRAGHDRSAEGKPLDASALWQPMLWRALRNELGTDPAEQLVHITAALRAGEHALDLPSRVFIIALGALASSQIEALDALAVHRQVHVLLLHPSPGWWAHALGHATSSHGISPLPRVAIRARHPLLTTWGQVAYESHLALRSGVHSAQWHQADDEQRDTAPTCLLQRLQFDLRADRDPGEGVPMAWSPSDRSVQVHACHGATRQVEVVRDAIAHLVDQPGSGLELRDIVVLCPDLETYGPLLQHTLGELAGYGLDSGLRSGGLRSGGLRSGGLRFPLTVAQPGGQVGDTSGSSLVDSLIEIVRTVQGRCSASAVTALAAHDAVQRASRFNEADLASLPHWIELGNVRWGLDGDHLCADGVPNEAEVITWEAAIDRLLLGVAMAPTHSRIAIGDRSPSPDVGLDDAIGLGRLADFVYRLRTARATLIHAQPAGQWVAALRSTAASLLCGDPERPWQYRQLAATLDLVDTQLAGTPGADSLVVSPTEILSILSAAQSAAVASVASARWGGGSITACAMGDLRGVPHRAVIIIGLDEQSLRSTTAHPDDLLAKQPCVGDRDPRSEQRGLLLDAVLSAREHLVITYTGNDVRTNQAVPPTTPLAELLEVIDLCSTPAAPQKSTTTTTSTSEVLVVHHPRQAFAEANLIPGRLGTGQPWSFDPDALAGALARRSGGQRPSLARSVKVPDATHADTIMLDDVFAALTAPAAYFLSHGLGVRLPRQSDSRVDLVTTDPAGLDGWALANRLFHLRAQGDLSGAEAERRWYLLARSDGLLPPGRLGARAATLARTTVALLHTYLADQGLPLVADGQQLLDLVLPGGTRIIGTISGLHRDSVVVARPGRLRAKELVDAHLRVLALCAMGRSPNGLVVGVEPSKAKNAPLKIVSRSVTINADAEQASTALAQLVSLTRKCGSVAMPMPVAVAAAWAKQFGSAKTAYHDDLLDAATRFVFGDLAEEALATHCAPGTDEPGQQLAQRLWQLLGGQSA